VNSSWVEWKIIVSIFFSFFIYISNWNIIKSVRRPDIQEVYKRSYLASRGKKNKKIMITNHRWYTKTVVQRYNVLKKKDLISSKILSQSSKPLSFTSLQRHHKRHKSTIFHTTALRVLLVVPPSSIQIDYSSRHYPRQLKSTEENIPNGTSNLTMKQKMVH